MDEVWNRRLERGKVRGEADKDGGRGLDGERRGGGAGPTE